MPNTSKRMAEMTADILAKLEGLKQMLKEIDQEKAEHFRAINALEFERHSVLGAYKEFENIARKWGLVKESEDGTGPGPTV